MPGIIDGIKGILGGASPVGLGLTVASQIFGAVKGGKANAANDKLLSQQMEQNDARYGLNASRNYMDTNHAQNVIQMYRDTVTQAKKEATGRGAIAGASDEAVLAADTNIQDSMNNALSSVAAQGEQQQMALEQQYLQQQANLNQQRMAVNANKADNAANLVQNAGDMLNTMAFNSMFNKEPLDPGAGETVTSIPKTFDFQTAPLTPGTVTEDNYQVPAPQPNTFQTEDEISSYKQRQGNLKG